MYYMISHKFFAPFEDWPSRYLEEREMRITNIVKAELSNDFWEYYSQTILRNYYQKKILFRAKISHKDSIEFLQIWDSSTSSNQFEIDIAQQGEPLKFLMQKDFKIQVDKRNINYETGLQIVLDTIEKKTIIQFANSPYLLPGMIVGDPLKKGRGYLPYG